MACNKTKVNFLEYLGSEEVVILQRSLLVKLLKYFKIEFKEFYVYSDFVEELPFIQSKTSGVFKAIEIPELGNFLFVRINSILLDDKYIRMPSDWFSEATPVQVLLFYKG